MVVCRGCRRTQYNQNVIFGPRETITVKKLFSKILLLFKRANIELFFDPRILHAFIAREADAVEDFVRYSLGHDHPRRKAIEYERLGKLIVVHRKHGYLEPSRRQHHRPGTVAHGNGDLLSFDMTGKFTRSTERSGDLSEFTFTEMTADDLVRSFKAVEVEQLSRLSMVAGRHDNLNAQVPVVLYHGRK